MSGQEKIRVSWGTPVLPPAPPVESLEDRTRREAADAAWIETLRGLATRAIEELRREVGQGD